MDSKEIEKRARELEIAMNKFRRNRIMKKDIEGIKASEKHFLWMIANINNGKPVMPSEISKKLGVTMGAISHHVNSLEESGFLERTASAEDKRVIYLSLTVKGKEMVQKIKDIYWKQIRNIVTTLGDKDSAIFISLLNKLITIYK